MGQVTMEKPDNSGGGVPTGVVVLWSGAANAIPTGWALCNGSNGTPDLRDKFIVCAGGKYAVGAKGGAETVTLTVEQMPAHGHEIKFRTSNYVGAGELASGNREAVSQFDYSFNTENAGGNQPHENRPPYYALCYIMKL